MAEQKLWNGITGTLGDWSVAANWTPSGVPATGDWVILGPTSSQSVTAGLDNDGVELHSMHVHRDYTGDIGTSGSPLIIATENAGTPLDPIANKGKIIVQGSGKFFFKNGDGGTGKDTERLFIDTDNQTDTIELDGEINYLSVLKGRVQLNANYDGNDVYCAYRGNPVTDAIITDNSTNNHVYILVAGGAYTHNGSGIATWVVLRDGKFTFNVNSGGGIVIEIGGGSCVYNAAGSPATILATGGTVDFSQDPREKTVGQLVAFPDATIKLNPNITITRGGSIRPVYHITPEAGF